MKYLRITDRNAVNFYLIVNLIFEKYNRDV